MQPVERILQIANESEIARYSWRDRGVAPSGYINGMALVYARAYCRWKAGDAVAAAMAEAKSEDGARDALSWYDTVFAANSMRNDAAGPDTLRHLFVLLTGLGMRESSGKYCAGRDLSASNTSAETAEAGLFQTSFNARHASSQLPALFQQYSADSSGFLEVFQEGVHCSDADLENFGNGDGREFQRLSKQCPAFAAEFAAIGLRHIRTHWGPINRRTAEIRVACDDMFREVAEVVDVSPEVCAALQSGQVATETPPTLRHGMSGPAVMRLQEALRRKGFTLAADNAFGSQTETALRQFQSDNGLVADGIAGPATWAALI